MDTAESSSSIDATADDTRASLWPGIVLAAIVAAGLRLTFVTGGLPGLPGPDEQAMVRRAEALTRGDLPDLYDWPTGALLLLAGALRLARLPFVGILDGTADAFVLGRVMFALVGVGLVVLAGWLGAALAPARDRRWVSWGTAGLVAVAYVAVRMSRTMHPETLQAALVVASLVWGVQFDRTRGRRALVAAAALAGAAASVKYLGGVALVVLVLSILTSPDNGPGGRVRSILIALTSAAGAFILLVPGVLVHPAVVGAGVNGQLSHQGAGHPGFDGSSPAWTFHLSQSLPGTWGWFVCLLALVGLAMALWSGSRAQRLVAAYVIASFLLVGSSTVQFPSYVLLFLAPLGVFAMVGARGLARSLRAGPVLAGLVVAASLVPTVVNDVRLVRSSTVDDTRSRSAAILDEISGPIVEERYTDLVGRRSYVGSLGDDPEVVDCRCYVVISSFIEDRYRADPQQYALELGVYDEIRERGEIVTVVRPDQYLSYRWDHLPQWGLDGLPLTGPFDTVGPTITIIDLRHPKARPS